MQANSFQVCVNSLCFAGGMTNSSAQLERKWHKRRLNRQRVLLMTNLMRIFFFCFLSDEEERGGGSFTEWTENSSIPLGLSGFLYRDFHGSSSMSATTFWARKLFHSNFSQLFPLRRCTALLLRFPFSTIEWAAVKSLTLPTCRQVTSFGFGSLEDGNGICTTVCGSLCLLLSPLGRSQG